MRHALCSIRVVVACVAIATMAASAQPPADTARSATERAVNEALAQHRSAEALARAKAWLDRAPGDAGMLALAARAAAQAGDQRVAAGYLKRAIEEGFTDFATIESGPDFAGLRRHESWAVVQEAMRAARARNEQGTLTGAEATKAVDAWRMRFTSGYRVFPDGVTNTILVTTQDPTSRSELMSMLAEMTQNQVGRLFGKGLAQPVAVIVASGADGEGDGLTASRAGRYEHGMRRLLTRDTGATLRHEFTHALHFAHMERVNQVHPIWLREGLATVFETYRTRDDGSFEFLPNERADAAMQLLATGAAPALRRLLTMPEDDFQKDGESTYPLVRSLMEYTASRGAVERLYAEAVAGFRDDPTCTRALERALGCSLEEIERAWAAWARERGTQGFSTDPTQPSIGVTTEDHPDGARIVRFVTKSAARDAGLRPGDVIVGVDSEPVRSVRELGVALTRSPRNETLAIRFRRGDSYSILAVRRRP
ncbi:MAG: PDZ domain-containing protein [Planctomycetes bacterium]|nr:PDZ domain-containing protein [Planctomycetota bacterium]